MQQRAATNFASLHYDRYSFTSFASVTHALKVGYSWRRLWHSLQWGSWDISQRGLEFSVFFGKLPLPPVFVLPGAVLLWTLAHARKQVPVQARAVSGNLHCELFQKSWEAHSQDPSRVQGRESFKTIIRTPQGTHPESEVIWSHMKSCYFSSLLGNLTNRTTSRKPL